MHALIALLRCSSGRLRSRRAKVPSRSPRVGPTLLYFVLLDRFADGDTTTTRMSIARPKAPFTAAI